MIFETPEKDMYRRYQNEENTIGNILHRRSACFA